VLAYSHASTVRVKDLHTWKLILASYTRNHFEVERQNDETLENDTQLSPSNSLYADDT